MPNMNGLMIAFAFSLPYHVLRTAAAAGVRVHVLGSGPSRGWVYDSAGEIHRDLLAGSLSYPVTVKPTNRSGGIGVIHIRDESEIGQLEPIDYRPILVQQHIVGETIGISVMCRAGKILAH